MNLRIPVVRRFNNVLRPAFLQQPSCAIRTQSLVSKAQQLRRYTRNPALECPQKWSSAGSVVSDYGSSSHTYLEHDDTSSGLLFTLTDCPGCGALAQVVDTGAAGYYSTKRKAVFSYIRQQAAQRKGREKLDSAPVLDHPLCDRCHDLIYHETGASILHPSLDNLADIISETPHKYNHIYHVVDAADFPMSLVRSLQRALSASYQRSKNRRSKSFKFMHGRLTQVTFVITRSDLLAPNKEQVDRLMPTLVEILREELGSSGKDVRLGNVCCVSAKRGWWVTNLKGDIWERGGGGWMVGKVNVGKSNLFEAVFPKGPASTINFDNVRRSTRLPIEAQERLERGKDEQDLIELQEKAQQREKDDEDEERDSLLPPARTETPYPIMPTISSLPGTTAAPIRIPFGNGKGELIDLPGLARSDIENFVIEKERRTLLMKSRIVPTQFVIKPGTSLLLGGLIQIKAVDPDIVIMAYPFTNLASHLTSSIKAEQILTGVRPSGIDGLIATPAAQASMASAGKYNLRWDVTKYRAGPLTAPAAVGLKPRTLPFMVLSADVLIESIGWVELVAQVRKKRRSNLQHNVVEGRLPANSLGSPSNEDQPDEPTHFPEVEIFSPEGRFTAVRRPLNAWMMGGSRTKPGKTSQPQRPRRSMKSAKGSSLRTSDAPTIQ